MKAYKVRSLIYLSCFIIAAVVYYHMEQNENFQSALLTSKTADLHPEDHLSAEQNEEADKGLE